MLYTDLRPALFVGLQAIQAANPTTLKQVYKARPAALGALSCAWVDECRSQMFHSAGVRRWLMEADIYVCSGGLDNEEAQTRMDTATSLVVEWFTDNPHFMSGNSVGEPVGVRGPVFVDNGSGSAYSALVVTIGRIETQEGRG